MPELIIVLLVAFLLFGPQKLPDLGRSIGKAVKGFRNVTDDVRQSIEPDLDIVQHELTSAQENLASSASDVQNSLSLNPTDDSSNIDVDSDVGLTPTRSDSFRNT